MPQIPSVMPSLGVHSHTRDEIYTVNEEDRDDLISNVKLVTKPEAVGRVPGVYWVRFNPEEDWVIARYRLAVVSGRAGWQLLGLSGAVPERGNEEVQPVQPPVDVADLQACVPGP